MTLLEARAGGNFAYLYAAVGTRNSELRTCGLIVMAKTTKALLLLLLLLLLRVGGVAWWCRDATLRSAIAIVDVLQ